MFIMFNMHVGMSVHACACMHVCGAWDTPTHTLTHPHPIPLTHQPPHEGVPRISKNSIILELIKIISFCLMI